MRGDEPQEIQARAGHTEKDLVNHSHHYQSVWLNVSSSAFRLRLKNQAVKTLKTGVPNEIRIRELCRKSRGFLGFSMFGGWLETSRNLS